MADEKKPKKKVVRKVAGTATEEAYKKGQKSGRAAAAAKTRAKPRKKGPRQYRMKNPIKHMKASYGKFQSKHPYASSAVEVVTVGAAGVGIGAGVLQRLGVDVFSLLRGPIRKVPIGGKIYLAFANGVYQTLRKYT